MKKLDIDISKDFKVYEILPNLYSLEFKDRYKMCMHFLRVQEFYESPNPKFRNKAFDIFDFMEWYSKKYGEGSFTYPGDWSGFNVPGEVIKFCYDKLAEAELELDKYDKVMFDLRSTLDYVSRAGSPNDDPSYNFYLIGHLKSDRDTLHHEIAHGLFYLNKDYKKEMSRLVKELPKSIKNTIYKRFKALGYTPKVYIDECQAYMATGLMCGLSGKFQKHRKPFIETFRKYFQENS